MSSKILHSIGKTCLRHQPGFTSSRSQAEDAQPAGINPLMQTPAPATRGSVFVPPLATALQQARTAQAVLRKTKISPKKLNEFARLIRRMHIDDALVQCQIAPNKAAKLCYKLLLSAKDNAEKDKGLDPEKLRIDRAFVGKGQHSKRMNTHARGRSGVRHVYHSHLTIILAEGQLKRVTRFRPPNAQWNKHKRSIPASVASQQCFAAVSTLLDLIRAPDG
ncbi:hypothetical protein WJX79_006356 [Trebouxia sp. C0005]